MSEENKPRTINEIQQEYQGYCLKAGDLQYRIDAFKRDLDLTNERMRALNAEAAAVKAAESNAAAEAAATENKESA